MDTNQNIRGKWLLIAILIICIIFATALLPSVNDNADKNSNREKMEEDIPEDVSEEDEWHLLNAIKSSLSIIILAFILVGFGFLMAFVRKYGYTSAIATYLLVSVTIPLYLCIRSLWSNDYSLSTVDIETLILAELATISVIIAIGATLGRINTNQYIIIALFFIPLYAMNEWMLFSGSNYTIPSGKFLDTAGSVFVHTFGAFFGMGLVLMLTKEKEKNIPINSSKRSNHLGLLGSMFLWAFFPAITAAMVEVDEIPYTVINTILAICGATISTYVFSILIRDKIEVLDLMRGTLAGGVAISATCNYAKPGFSILIGMIAGAICVIGYSMIQPRIEKIFGIVDTCSVHVVHGFTGIFGGLAALALYLGSSTGPGADSLSDISPGWQIAGIIFTVVFALTSGSIVGYIVSIFGGKKELYDDIEEFGE